jgi:hypothetical protein
MQGAAMGDHGMMEDVDDFVPADFHPELKSAASPLSSTSPISASSTAQYRAWRPSPTHASGAPAAHAGGAPLARYPSQQPQHAQPMFAPGSALGMAVQQHSRACAPVDHASTPQHPDMTRSLPNGLAHHHAPSPPAAMALHPGSPAGMESLPQLMHGRHSASYAEVRAAQCGSSAIAACTAGCQPQGSFLYCSLHRLLLIGCASRSIVTPILTRPFPHNNCLTTAAARLPQSCRVRLQASPAQAPRSQHGSPLAAAAAPFDGGRSGESRILSMPPHCPPALRRREWHVQQFKLEKVLYVGSISRVLRAVDLATGMTVALKVYKRHKLSDMEKCALPQRPPTARQHRTESLDIP